MILLLLGQILINMLVFRWYLRTHHPHADSSWERVAFSGGISPLGGLVAVIGVIVDLVARTGITFTLIGLGLGVLVQVAIIRGFHRTGWGAAFGMFMLSSLVGAALGVTALLHPIVPVIVAGIALWRQTASERALQDMRAWEEAAEL